MTAGAADRGELDLAAIRGRHARLERLADKDATGLDGMAWTSAVAIAANLSAADVPDLLAENEALRGDLAAATNAGGIGYGARREFAAHAHIDAVRAHLTRARVRATVTAREVKWLEDLLALREGGRPR